MTNEYQTKISTLEAIITKVMGYDPSSYDIFLAHDTDNLKRSNSREHRFSTALHSAIDAMCEQLGHRLFVPYYVLESKEYGELIFRDAFTVCNQIMIPKTRFFLCNLNAPTRSLTTMITKAIELNKPQIYFYDKEIASVEPAIERTIEMANDKKNGFRAAIGYRDIAEFMRLLKQVIKYNFK